MNIYKLINELILYEKNCGVIFNDEGFPLFNKEMFFNGNINDIYPYEHRRKATTNDAICFYEHDLFLYRKLSLEKLEFISNELLNYRCFIGFDLSLFNDMSSHLEKFYILTNLVIDIFFILKGNRMIPNLRVANIDYSHLFKDSSYVSCGTLGCAYDSNIRNLNKEMISKYIELNPLQKIIIYGPLIIKHKNIIHIKALGWRKEHE